MCDGGRSITSYRISWHATNTCQQDRGPVGSSCHWNTHVTLALAQRCSRLHGTMCLFEARLACLADNKFKNQKIPVAGLASGGFCGLSRRQNASALFGRLFSDFDPWVAEAAASSMLAIRSWAACQHGEKGVLWNHEARHGHCITFYILPYVLPVSPRGSGSQLRAPKATLSAFSLRLTLSLPLCFDGSGLPLSRHQVLQSKDLCTSPTTTIRAGAEATPSLPAPLPPSSFAPAPARAPRAQESKTPIKSGRLPWPSPWPLPRRCGAAPLDPRRFWRHFFRWPLPPWSPWPPSQLSPSRGHR